MVISPYLNCTAVHIAKLPLCFLMPANDPGLFGSSTPDLPSGFRYTPELITREHERELVEHIKILPLKEFEFQGFTGKRRVVSFGWRYDFNDRELQKVDEVPEFLLPLRDPAAEFGFPQPTLAMSSSPSTPPASRSAGTATRPSSPR